MNPVMISSFDAGLAIGAEDESDADRSFRADAEPDGTYVLTF